jgi:hypothetical protein
MQVLQDLVLLCMDIPAPIPSILIKSVLSCAWNELVLPAVCKAATLFGAADFPKETRLLYIRHSEIKHAT